MFETYLDHQRPNLRRTKMLRRALALSTAATCTALGWMWLEGKLAVSLISPPSINFIMVQMESAPLPSAPVPPPPPIASDNERSHSNNDEAPEIPTETAPRNRPVPASSGAQFHVGAKNLPTFAGFPNMGSASAASAPAKSHGDIGESRAVLASVMSRIVYQPPSPQSALLQTTTGRFSRKSGTSTVSFCIEPGGSISQVRTVRGFPGDPQIDAIFREFVQKWRAKPLVVGGIARRECTEKTFHVVWK
jgi:outer membrane biosynthesis protein TonB